ncbi:MAG: hypothetical protein AAF587_41670 [Bacteroidota bacterium]
MRFLLYSTLALLLLSGTACNKEGLLDEKGICFELVYPITVNMPDGSSSSVDSEKAMDQLIEAWFVAHPDSKQEPTFQFPIQVVFDGNVNKTLNNVEELDKAHDGCHDEKGKEEWEEYEKDWDKDDKDGDGKGD